jgi:hypothetical protein
MLILLWVRSNWYADEYWITVPFHRGLGFFSADNLASITIERRDPDPRLFFNGYQSHDVNLNANLRPKTHLGFCISREANISFIYFPYWFSILLVTTLAALPWLRWRFSLRTLLIATTLVAVVLGLIVWLLARPPTAPPIDVGDFPRRVN